MRTSGRIANDPPGPDRNEPGGEPAATRNSDFVQSLDRGLAVIRAFGPDRERLSLSEVGGGAPRTRAPAGRPTGWTPTSG